MTKEVVFSPMFSPRKGKGQADADATGGRSGETWPMICSCRIMMMINVQTYTLYEVFRIV